MSSSAFVRCPKMKIVCRWSPPVFFPLALRSNSCDNFHLFLACLSSEIGSQTGNNVYSPPVMCSLYISGLAVQGKEWDEYGTPVWFFITVSAQSNYCINFLLYILSGQQFRQKFLDVVFCYRKSEVSTNRANLVAPSHALSPTFVP